MIIFPSTAQVLQGIIHEMNTSLKEGLDDPVKAAQIDTIVGVLAAVAVRTEHEDRVIDEEVTAIMSTANNYLSAGKDSTALAKAVDAFDEKVAAAKRYEQASEILSLMSDIGSDAGPELCAELRQLMSQRLQNETAVIGGGFEAAGRS